VTDLDDSKRAIGDYKVVPHKLHTINRYKLSIWDGSDWLCTYWYTVEEAESMAEQVKAELLK